MIVSSAVWAANASVSLVEATMLSNRSDFCTVTLG
jgi:hypothetical protein